MRGKVNLKRKKKKKRNEWVGTRLVVPGRKSERLSLEGEREREGEGSEWNDEWVRELLSLSRIRRFSSSFFSSWFFILSLSCIIFLSFLRTIFSQMNIFSSYFIFSPSNFFALKKGINSFQLFLCSFLSSFFLVIFHFLLSVFLFFFFLAHSYYYLWQRINYVFLLPVSSSHSFIFFSSTLLSFSFFTSFFLDTFDTSFSRLIHQWELLSRLSGKKKRRTIIAGKAFFSQRERERERGWEKWERQREKEREWKHSFGTFCKKRWVIPYGTWCCREKVSLLEREREREKQVSERQREREKQVSERQKEKQVSERERERADAVYLQVGLHGWMSHSIPFIAVIPVIHFAIHTTFFLVQKQWNFSLSLFLLIPSHFLLVKERKKERGERRRETVSRSSCLFVSQI